MRRISRSGTLAGSLLLVLGLVSASAGAMVCPANQNPNKPPNAAGKGKGKACTDADNSNLPLFQPVRLRLNNDHGKTCPDSKVPIVVSPDPAVVNRYDPPNKVVWVVQGKKTGTTWTLWGGNAKWEKGSSTGVNPFPGNMAISGTDNAYWSDSIATNLPDPTTGTTAIEWKYTIKVTGITDAGGNACADVEIDPIILFPGG